MSEIRTILHRRTDLSTFVVHLTRSQGNGHTAQDAFVDYRAWRVPPERRVGFGLRRGRERTTA